MLDGGGEPASRGLSLQVAPTNHGRWRAGATRAASEPSRERRVAANDDIYGSTTLMSHIARMAAASNADPAKTIIIVAHNSMRFRRRFGISNRR